MRTIPKDLNEIITYYSQNPVEQTVHVLCKNFIEKHNITCAESIYQNDDVVQDAYQLIEDICEVIGYVEIDEDE